MTVAVPEFIRGADAVMVVVPLALPGITVTFAMLAPARTVTVGATVAAVVLLLARVITTPLGPAGADRFTVSMAGALTANGFGVSVISTGAATVIVTVVGVPLA